MQSSDVCMCGGLQWAYHGFRRRSGWQYKPLLKILLRLHDPPCASHEDLRSAYAGVQNAFLLAHAGGILGGLLSVGDPPARIADEHPRVDRVRDGVAVLAGRCLGHGLRFDRTRIPGVKRAVCNVHRPS